LTHLDLYYK